MLPVMRPEGEVPAVRVAAFGFYERIVMIGEIKSIVKRTVKKACGFVKQNAKAVTAGAVAVVSTLSAQATGTPVDDANAIVDTATTTFNNTSALIVAAAAFSIVMAFVWRVKSRKG